MLSLIQSEAKKHAHHIQLYISFAILIAIQTILLTIITQSFDLSGFGSLASTAFRKNILAFLGFSYLFTIFSGAIVGYYLVSSEYINHTWELLILSIKHKTKVIWAKFLLSFIFFTVYQILSLGLYCVVLQTYFHYSIDWGFLSLVFFALWFGNSLFFTLQLSAHFLISNSMTAIVCSLALILLPIFLGNNFLFTMLMPLFSISYLVTTSSFSLLVFVGLSLWALIWSGGVAGIVARYFRV